MHHPWREFGRWPAWRLVMADLPEGLLGLTSWAAHTVTLDRQLLQVERRCTIAHEVVHLERGPLPDDPILAAKEEAAVEREAARRLIALQPLGEALAWAQDLEEAADELWVDLDILKTRLDHLHPSERAYLQRRLETP